MPRWPGWLADSKPLSSSQRVDAAGAALAAGVLVYLGYVVSVGGDYMAGRFFGAPFLVALLGLLLRFSGPTRSAVWVAVAIGLQALFLPASPLLSGPGFARPEIDAHGIGDQRGIFFPVTSLYRWWSHDQTGPFPDYRWTHEGLALRDRPEAVFVRANMGFLGYAAGTEKILIDRLGLTDPLLARLPSRAIWRIGHFPRRVPEGYAESAASPTTGILDPEVAATDAMLRSITRDPLLDPDRLHAIAIMNLGLDPSGWGSR